LWGQHVTLRLIHCEIVVSVGWRGRYTNERPQEITGWIQAVLSSVGRFPTIHDTDGTGEGTAR